MCMAQKKKKKKPTKRQALGCQHFKLLPQRFPFLSLLLHSNLFDHAVTICSLLAQNKSTVFSKFWPFCLNLKPACPQRVHCLLQVLAILSKSEACLPRTSPLSSPGFSHSVQIRSLLAQDKSTVFSRFWQQPLSFPLKFCPM